MFFVPLRFLIKSYPFVEHSIVATTSEDVLDENAYTYPSNESNDHEASTSKKSCSGLQMLREDQWNQQ